MRQTHSFAIACAIMLAAAAIFIQPVIAQPIDRAGYAPSSGGTFTVNTAADSDTRQDGAISLREAVSIANGTLTGPFDAVERSQLSGCTFTMAGMITNNCGNGDNLIRFTATLTQVVLTSSLPVIDRNPITVDGAVNSGVIMINAQGLVLSGFRVAADDFTLKNVAVIGTISHAVRMEGSWKGLEVADSFLGVPPNASGCNDPRLTFRTGVGVSLVGGSGTGAADDGTAYLHSNVIGCTRFGALSILDAPYVHVGEDKTGAAGRNWIGVTPAGLPISNDEAGIILCCSNLVQGTRVMSNSIAYNGLNGLQVDASAAANLIQGNDLHHNQLAGIVIISSSLTSLIDNASHDNGNSGLWLTEGASTANTIRGGQYYRNGAAGITEGQGASLNSWLRVSTYDNAGLGIDKDDNGAPGATGGIVITSIVQSGGVVTVSGQYNGQVLLATTYHVELYRLAPDPTGFGEGRTYLGAYDVKWNLQGDTTWHIRDPRGQAGCYTALLTVQDLFGTNSTSYEFSVNFGQWCFDVFLPAVLK